MSLSKKLPLAALSLIGVMGSAWAASCNQTPPTSCYQDDCTSCHCLGPENYQVNAPVGPRTCNGDFEIKIAGIYWKAEQEGLAYAIRNEVATLTPFGTPDMVNLVDATLLSPKFGWDFGFKFGLGYTMSCDGWDIGAVWTSLHDSAQGHVESTLSDNDTLIPLWTATQAQMTEDGGSLFATDIQTLWKLELNLIDIELGRKFWTSKYLSLRPVVGLRIAQMDQDFDITHQGGSWRDIFANQQLKGVTKLDNDFKGVGLRSGLDTVWNVGCGFSFYGDLAISIIYGKFHVENNETVRNSTAPFSKSSIAETEESFRASRSILDLAAGIQWETMLCECSYGLTLSLGWEQHHFFNQNQLWKIKRFGGLNFMIDSGENLLLSQSKGSLTTEGWTLAAKFAF